MNQDQLRAKVMEGAAALSGMDARSCLLAIRESMELPEPAAQVWEGLCERERRSVLLFAAIPAFVARREWVSMPDQTRASIRTALASMAAWAGKLDAECRALRGVAA